MADGIDVGAARDVLLEDVVLDGAGELVDVGAVRVGDGDVEREQDAGGRVDGHRGGDVVEGDAVEEALHVFDGVDGDADLADFAEGHGVVGVVADLRGQIEGDGEAGGPVGEQEFVAAVGLSSASPMPAYWRMVQRRPRYMVGWMPRVKGYSPG